MKTLTLASLLLLSLTGCCRPPRLNPPVLRLDHEAAFIYDTLLETEEACL